MCKDYKTYHEVPKHFLEALPKRGYQPLRPEHQELFDPYYDAMNEHWAANTCFLALISWEETYPMYFKVMDGYIIVVCYLRTFGYPISIPFIGKYTKEMVKEGLGILKEDFAAFKAPIVLMDIVPWMYEYYKDGGIDFEVEDERDYMDYTFTRDEFLAGMDTQDDRYRYRYFKRKNEYETIEIDENNLDDCIDFLKRTWCNAKTCDYCSVGCLLDVTAKLKPIFENKRADGIIVKVDGVVEGFCVVSARNGLGVYQYKNANNRIKGINEYLLRESFERYLSDVDEINYTEDLGEPNLRRYKEHMAPSYTLLSKYTLYEKE